MATINNTSTPYYIISDHLNSSSILTDNNGNIIEQSQYEPYGKESYNYTTTEVGDDYKFTGKEADVENSLQYFGARYLDNNTARFYAVDPLVIDLHNIEGYNKQVENITSDPQQLNSYSYARNNPIVITDPTGQYIETALDLISLGLSYYDYQHNKSNWNKVFLGLDIIGVAAPLPSLGIAKNGYRTYKIAKYFEKITKNVDELINLGELFVKNVNFKFTQRAWSAGEASNDVASLVGHYSKHADDVGATSVQDYYNKANNLINSVDNKNIFRLDGVYAEGFTDFFNPKTKELVGLNRSGQISSYQLVTDKAKYTRLEEAIKKIK